MHCFLKEYNIYVINDMLFFFIIIKSLLPNFNEAPRLSQEKEYTFQGSHINMIKTQQNQHHLSHKLVQYCGL